MISSAVDAMASVVSVAAMPCAGVPVTTPVSSLSTGAFYVAGSSVSCRCTVLSAVAALA
ncbi:hypothetical protein PR002_g28452 [Phytophthora rubi]|uniref:Uncharacterized protein n=1 Tax=Phytophthora rubi TaxID=129364 RepID=A0A6A3HAF4_9STRA|nr:hypothetical protein PR002_g28452 [Phytophthora rubi]